MFNLLKYSFGAAMFIAAVVALNVSNSNTVYAAPVTVLIGDDDGFGGTHGVTSSPGDAFSLAATAGLGTIAPGFHANSAALDVSTESPWETYIFSFDFAYDLTSISSISSAIVEIQHGSLGKRTTGIPPGSGPGFGFAEVSASTGGPATTLGDFLDVDTSPTGSALEESVKISTFDVSSLVSPATAGILSLTIDGSVIVGNPVDHFLMDFARLTVTGDTVTAVPIPAALPLMAGGLGLLGFVGWRRKRKAA